ncbi:LEPR-XLL domain-containing protein, partial [Rhodoblastus acidophilus]|nr:LEPR-XLL domain-containing protein [Rhodoblastus acidophilus]
MAASTAARAPLDSKAAEKPSGPEYFRAKPKRRPAYALEPVEPRLLMSADLSYSTAASGQAFYLVATGARSFALDLNSAGGAQVATFTQAGSDNSVSIDLSTSLGLSNSNTLHVDLDTFNLLNSSFFSPNGGLVISFEEGKAIAGGSTSNPDHLSVDAATNPNIGFGISITSDSDITTSGHASITGDFSLTSSQKASDALTSGLFVFNNAGVTLSGANYQVSGAFKATAHDDVTASTNGLGMSAISGALISNNSTSTIAITNNSVVNAGSIELDSKIDGTMTAAADQATVQLVVIQGAADPEVAIDGSSQLIAATVTATAESNVTISATTTPGGGGSASADAAISNVTYSSGATLTVTGGALVNATSGAANLNANSTLDATTKGDASGASAGAGVAVSTIYGDTIAKVDNATVDGGSVTIGASTDRTITVEAKSSQGGSSGSSGDASGESNYTSQKTLSDNNASTSDGSISVAGAVAVSVDTGATTAYVNNGTINAGAGAASVTAASADNASVTADGSSTTSGAT